MTLNEHIFRWMRKTQRGVSPLALDVFCCMAMETQDEDTLRHFARALLGPWTTPRERRTIIVALVERGVLVALQAFLKVVDCAVTAWWEYFRRAMDSQSWDIALYVLERFPAYGQRYLGFFFGKTQGYLPTSLLQFYRENNIKMEFVPTKIFSRRLHMEGVYREIVKGLVVDDNLPYLAAFLCSGADLTPFAENFNASQHRLVAKLLLAGEASVDKYAAYVSQHNLPPKQLSADVARLYERLLVGNLGRPLAAHYKIIQMGQTHPPLVQSTDALQMIETTLRKCQTAGIWSPVRVYALVSTFYLFRRADIPLARWIDVVCAALRNDDQDMAFIVASYIFSKTGEGFYMHTSAILSSVSAESRFKMESTLRRVTGLVFENACGPGTRRVAALAEFCLHNFRACTCLQKLV
jgi:hypothetical protein